MFLGDLRTVSKILANKKYILGDTICAEDCSIFGFVAEATYGMPDSPYEKIIQGRPRFLTDLNFEAFLFLLN